jgi:hypothetical protein
MKSESWNLGSDTKQKLLKIAAIKICNFNKIKYVLKLKVHKKLLSKYNFKNLKKSS